MNSHLPGDLTIADIQRLLRGRTFRICFYMNDDLMNSDIADMDMSVRATNALKRAGIKTSMPDCDDYEDYDDFMDDWDGYMPDGSDAEDYWEDW